MSGMRMMQFLTIRKQSYKGKQLMLDDNFYNHLDISFSLWTSDWNKDLDKGRFTETTFPARQCTLDDFGKGKSNAKKLFDSWNGITILCPNIPKEIDPVLYGG